MNRIRYGIMSMAIFFALALSALNVAPAFADEATPPEVVTEVTEPAAPVEEATPPSEGQVVAEPETQSPSVAEVIESLPEDTTLVVLGENGEALPLASVEAQEVLEVADPQWCPVGVAPGSASCSGVKNSFNGGDPNLNLLAWLLANQTAIGKAGVIWIDEDYDSGAAGEGVFILLDGMNYTTMDNFALTINGGWGGGTTLNANNPSEFDVPFLIVNWNGAVTINNIVITGATGPSHALTVVNSGTGGITLNNVDVVGNTTDEGGANLISTGNVTINNSTFNNNTGTFAYGLEVDAGGAITLKNVTANNNTFAGAQIINAGASTPKPVTITGTNHFSYNGTWGLRIVSKGVITLNNITAMDNVNGYGVYADNCDYLAGVCNFGVSNGVSVKGTNNFSDNGWDGLRVISGGAITVNNITANSNGTSGLRPAATVELGEDFDATGKGAFLLNIGGSTPKNITISGTNIFNNNASNGLSALTLGMLTVNNITANGNNCNPAKDTDTSWCAGALLFGNSGVTQTGYGRFEGNDDHADQMGLFVMINGGKGSITLNNLFAFSNGNYGVRVDADGALATTPINVTINGENIFEENGNTGLFIATDGAVTLNNLTAEGNGGRGVYIENNTLTKPVTLKGVNTFLGNSDHGLFIISYGAITTSAITASGNFGGGAYLDNCVEDVLTCDALTAQPITMNGNNLFEANQGVSNTGLQVLSRGVITLTNLTASNNTSHGISINNKFANSMAGVTLKGYVNTTGNAGIGLAINTNGVVSVINLNANDNTIHGVYIGTSGKAITVSGTNVFNGNSGYGLRIETLNGGAIITTNALTAIGNGLTGVSIDNCGYDAPPNCFTSLVQPITMNGNNFFQSNGGSGLNILSRGAVTINNLNVSYNTNSGISIFNGANNAVGGVTIKGYLTALANNSHGVDINSNGAVTLANVSASYNNTGSGMVIVNNANAAMPVNVTITGKNNFNSNDQAGLFITTYGAVLLNNIISNNNNAGGGAVINNSGGSLAKPVTLNGNNTFNGNAGNGLTISSLGAIKINNIAASYNTGDGADLSNNGIIENQPVTITGYGIFNNNGQRGLRIFSNGSITLANLTANNNTTNHGAYIETEYNNLTNTTYANVTLTGVNTFNNNGSSGLSILTDGNITVSNITANNNVVTGTRLDNLLYANSGVTGIRTVTVTGSNMFNENTFGLVIESNGTVTLTRIIANLNDDGANGRGLLVSTNGAINLTCGAMYNNTQQGYSLTAGVGKVITLKGVYTYGNPSAGNSTNVTPVITRACPLP